MKQSYYKLLGVLPLFFFQQLLAEIGLPMKRADSLANAGQYAEALNLTLHLIPQIEKSGSCHELSEIYMLVGRYQYYLRQKPKAISWFKKSNEYSTSCHIDSLIGKNYRNIGAIYWELGKPDSANIFLLKASYFLKKVNLPKELSTLYAILFELHFRSYKDVSMGKNMLDSCAYYSYLCDDQNQQAFYLMKKGIFLMETGKCKEAQLVYRESEKKYRSLKNLDGISYALNGLFSSQALCNDGPGYLGTIQAYNDIRDQIFRNKTAEKLALYEVTFNTKQKQIENEALKQKNQFLIIIFIFAVAFLAFLFFFFYRNQQAKKEKNHQENLRQLQRQSFVQMVELQEKERAEFAANLHDGIGHLISAIQLNLSAIKVEDMRNKEILQNTSKIINTAAVEVRQISHRIMPQSLIELGLVASIDELVNRLEIAQKLHIEFTCDNNFDEMKKDFQIAIYRIVQEVLSNMIKHAEASLITIELKKDNEFVYLHITDNGKGFEEKDLILSDGIGWQNIRSRVDLFNGKLTIISKLKAGSQLLMKFPIT
ncbi:MAG TPA: sensor histidine kinase [Bacteroidia bacterium]|nr:sensor histidine kinase [Bacteroidia bacterium]